MSFTRAMLTLIGFFLGMGITLPWLLLGFFRYLD
jgi:hypothetical protein